MIQVKKIKKNSKTTTLDMHETRKQQFSFEPMRDPIHNYIDYNLEIEEKIIDTEIFQRLRRIYQLSSGRFVYPGATHSRFEHSLGTMHLAGKFAERVLYNPVSKIETTYEDKNYLLETVRLAGLLHDIGHGPYSHAFDEAIISTSKNLEKNGVRNHEDLGKILIKNSDISKILNKKYNEDILDDYLEMVDKLLAVKLSPAEDKAIIALRQIIKEFLYPADILDFLKRDGYFTGAREYGLIDCDRLIRSTSIKDSDLVLDDRALGACGSLFDSRYKMFKNVYYHRTCRAIDYMIKKTMTLTNKILGLEESIEKCIDGDINDFLELDEHCFLKNVVEKTKSSKEKDLKKANKIARAIINRDIPWRLPSCFCHPLTFEQGTMSQYRMALRGLKATKEALEKYLEEEFEKYIDKDDDIFFVDHPNYKYLPDSPFDISGGKLLIRKISGKQVEYKEWSVSHFFEERRSCFTIEFRVYIDKILQEQQGKKIEKTVKNAFREVFSLEPGVTM